jgi:alpha-N-arabinofuranosidase
MRDAMVAAVTFDIFHRHCQRVRMANIAQTVNVLQAMILTNGEKMLLTPTYHVFEMYKVHQDATLVPLDLETEDYELGDKNIPAISTTASRDADGKVHVSLSNFNPNKDIDVAVDIRGMDVAKVAGRILTAETMQAHNTFDAPETVKPAEFDGATLNGTMLTVKMPGKSIVALELT